ncbi:aminotransferase class I/II-fold pyridoxal phosphate-dependent enzyme [Actinoallomurus sp. NBC_01490]|uniref:aminotransferase class I/II-fold pyridoxal phosphate-dependent enzyme n=1 Tax=Actinoallomurus sp. NBC_01490 TaxID=2903557 RepID=UPI002E2F4781|nr:aminotransferase class I/II-fold pyridoxal phosphate-dependent enzyme [Actinoallomurus sp. NBC_01490]
MPSTHLPSAVYEYGRLTAAAQLSRITELVSIGRLGAIGGTQVPELERLAAALVGRADAVAVASATAGIEATLRALGVGRGRDVIIPAVGWVSVGAAVQATGATVRVAPITEHLTPTWEAIASLLTPRTAAVILAHLRGMPAPDIEHIAAELRERGIPLIEDCAQVWGVRTGPCSAAGTHGLVAIYSVETHKLVTAGEGGLVLSDDRQLMNHLRALAGDTRVSTPHSLWRGNARMSEITAALAIPQLHALDDLTGRLRPLQLKAAQLLTDTAALSVLPTTEQRADSNGMHVGAWWPSSEAAQTLRTHLQARGLRVWHPTAGDLHVHDAWPTKAESASPAMDHYLDVQIPALDPPHHQRFLDLLLGAIEQAGVARARMR